MPKFTQQKTIRRHHCRIRTGQCFSTLSTFTHGLEDEFWDFLPGNSCRNFIPKPNLEDKWVFPKIGVPQNGWFIRDNPIRIDDLGYHYFWETPKSCQIMRFHWSRQRGKPCSTRKTLWIKMYHDHDSCHLQQNVYNAPRSQQTSPAILKNHQWYAPPNKTNNNQSSVKRKLTYTTGALM